MAKLHELLAVEADLEGRCKAILGETTKVFKEKGNLFSGSIRTYTPFVDDGVDYPQEHLALATTVGERLSYTMETVSKYYDAILQKESTNQLAKADLVVDGDVIAADLPATFLLGMESRLKLVRSAYANIPTLELSKEWKLDEGKGTGVYVIVHPEESFKTQKTMKSQVLYEATKEHPAQIEKWDETENVGKYTKTLWSGMITPARKSELLGRIDKLIVAVKKARQRANATQVNKVNIGSILAEYINK